MSAGFAPAIPNIARRPIGPLGSGLGLIETEPGVFDFSATTRPDAVIEETTTPGVFDFTDEPVGRAQARLLMIGTRGVIL